MSRLTVRLRMATFAFLLVSSGAAVDQPRLRGSTRPEASGGALDDVQLLQNFALREAEPQRGGITIMTASKTVQLGMDGQVPASPQPVLTQVRFSAGGPDWIKDRLFATHDKTVAALIVGVTTTAVLVLLCFRVPLPGLHGRRRKAVELPEVGELGAQQQQLKVPKGVTQWNWDDANWQGCLAEAVLRKQTFGTPKRKLRKLPDLPAPEHRLRAVGASYVVPIGWAPAAVAKNATGTTLSFGIPALPAVWPLRAVLTRPNPQSAWTKIDLCMDVIAAAELPPLLSCMVCAPFGEVHQQCSQTTGGTGSTVPCSQWLAIRNSGGAILASVMPKEKDPTKCVLQRQNKDRVSWDVDMRLDEREPLVVVSQLGQEIGQATSLGYRRSPPSEDSDASDDEEEMQQHFQFDTQPQAQTPESLLLLMTFLAMVSFQPTKLPQEKQE